MYRHPLDHTYLQSEGHDRHHRLIVKNTIETFGMRAGMRVVEVGAGLGRYTRLLREFDLDVVACEPDLCLLERLRARFSDDSRVVCSSASAEKLETIDLDCHLLCGFHVLHHLTPEGLLGIKRFLDRHQKKDDFRGWFFIEPNNLNPMYVLQILLTPAMSFKEERGIWMTDYDHYLASSGGGSCLMGRIGLYPPRRVFASLPYCLTQLLTDLTTRSHPLALYRVFGQRIGP